MTAFVRPEEVRKGNRRRVLAAIRRGGIPSRTDIGGSTGLSAATVSAIAADLIAEGILVQGSSGAAGSLGRGRPKVALAVNPEAAQVAVVNLQINVVSATVIDYAGEALSDSATDIPTASAGPEELREAMVDCLRQALARSGRRQVPLKRIAVGVQGVTDVAGSTLLWSPVVGVHPLPIRAWLEQAFRAPTHVSNDCELMAQALNWRSPERYGDNFAAILLSYGVGMGLFLRGGLVRGTRSSGMEFGHMTHQRDGALCRCGRRGCIEAYAGDYAIVRAARGEAEGAPPPRLAEPLDVAAIAEDARSGDERARAAIEAAGIALGTGLAGLFALVDAFPVALVGKGTLAFDLMEQPLRQALGKVGAAASASDAEIAIDCFPDERPLLYEGGAINALKVLDQEHADKPAALVEG